MVLKNQKMTKKIMKTETQTGFCQDKKMAKNKVAQLRKPGRISKIRKIILSFSSRRSAALSTLR